jgi:hypothetical protein
MKPSQRLFFSFRTWRWLTRPNLLQYRADPLHAVHLLAVRALNILLRRPRLPEDVPVPAEEDVIALIVQRQDLPTGQLGLRREQGVHGLGRQQTQWSLEAVEEELRLNVY